MRLGICQTQIMWEDKEKNKESARLWVEKAAGKGAELVLFPEMSFTGIYGPLERRTARRFRI